MEAITLYTQTSRFALMDARDKRGYTEEELGTATRISQALNATGDMVQFAQAITLLGTFYQRMTLATFGRDLPWRMYPSMLDGHNVMEIAYYGVPLAAVYLEHNATKGLLVVRERGTSARLTGREPDPSDMDLAKELITTQVTFMKSVHLVSGAPPNLNNVIEQFYPQQWEGLSTWIGPHMLAETLEQLLSKFTMYANTYAGFSGYGVMVDLLQFIHDTRKRGVMYRLTHRQMGETHVIREGDTTCDSFVIAPRTVTCISAQRAELLLR